MHIFNRFHSIIKPVTKFLTTFKIKIKIHKADILSTREYLEKLFLKDFII